MADLLIMVGSGAATTARLPWRRACYGEVMGGGYFEMMRGFGLGGGGWSYGLAAIGMASGIIILAGVMMIYNQPAKEPTWGALVWPFRF